MARAACRIRAFLVLNISFMGRDSLLLGVICTLGMRLLRRRGVLARSLRGLLVRRRLCWLQLRWVGRQSGKKPTVLRHIAIVFRERRGKKVATLRIGNKIQVIGLRRV